MATASRNEFKLIGPSGTKRYNRFAVTLSCHLFPEISAVNMEIRWFMGTDCVCVYKNRQVTEGRRYEHRVSLFTQELETGNVSLQLRDCKESDLGHYLCQVTDGDIKVEITVAVWPCTPAEKDDQSLYVCQRNREWTEDERMKMKSSASQIDYLRDRVERMRLESYKPPKLKARFYSATSAREWLGASSSKLKAPDLSGASSSKLKDLEAERDLFYSATSARDAIRPPKLKATSARSLFATSAPFYSATSARKLKESSSSKLKDLDLYESSSSKLKDLDYLSGPRKRRNSGDGNRPNMSGN